MAPFCPEASLLSLLLNMRRELRIKMEKKSRGCRHKGGTLLGIKHEQLAKGNVIQEQEGMWRIPDQGGNSRVNTL